MSLTSISSIWGDGGSKLLIPPCRSLDLCPIIHKGRLSILATCWGKDCLTFAIKQALQHKTSLLPTFYENLQITFCEIQLALPTAINGFQSALGNSIIQPCWSQQWARSSKCRSYNTQPSTRLGQVNPCKALITVWESGFDVLRILFELPLGGL